MAASHYIRLQHEFADVTQVTEGRKGVGRRSASETDGCVMREPTGGCWGDRQQTVLRNQRSNLQDNCGTMSLWDYDDACYENQQFCNTHWQDTGIRGFRLRVWSTTTCQDTNNAQAISLLMWPACVTSGEQASTSVASVWTPATRNRNCKTLDVTCGLAAMNADGSETAASSCVCSAHAENTSNEQHRSRRARCVFHRYQDQGQGLICQV